MMNVHDIQFAERFNGVTGSAIREIFKLLAKPGMISFAGGNPSESALPDAEMAEIAALDSGKRFFTMTLAQQEASLGSWHPAD